MKQLTQFDQRLVDDVGKATDKLVFMSGVNVKVARRSNICIVSYCGARKCPHRCLGIEVSSSVDIIQVNP